MDTYALEIFLNMKSSELGAELFLGQGSTLNRTTEFLQREPTALGALAPKDTNKIAEANNSKSPQRSQTCHTQTFVV